MTTIHFDFNAPQKEDPVTHKKDADVPQTTIEHLLAEAKVSSLPLVKGKVLVVDSAMTPGEGFQLLMDHNILGAPVWDSAHKKYIGFLDVRDLVDLVVHRYDQAHTPTITPPVTGGHGHGPSGGGGAHTPSSHATTSSSSSSTSPAASSASPGHGAAAAGGSAFGFGMNSGGSNTLRVETAVLPTGGHIHTSGKPSAAASAASASAKNKEAHKVSAFIEELLLTGEVMIGAKMTVSYLSRRHPFKSVTSDASLLDVAKTLAGETHRVPVVDAKTGLVTNIISQSSIIDFLNKHAKQVKAEMSKTVDDWKLGTSPVLAIRDNARAIEAFRVMSEKHMSGLAVCDASGMFLANTASTDLKLYLAHSNLGAQLLEEPILDFLSQLRQDDIKTDTRTKVPTLSVQSSAPLSLVIGRLAATKQHKIFVANASKQYSPAAVISLTDVLRTVLHLSKAVPSTPSNAGPAHGKIGADKKAN